MISFISGTVAKKQLPYVVIETGGVGYQIEVSLFTYEWIAAVGQPVQLTTHLVVREDAHLLYGFSSEQEKATFLAITKVSGFGPRIAMGMLSSNRPNELAVLIENADKAMLQKIPGIGSKSADRLIIELRDRLPVDETPLSQSALSQQAMSSNISDAEAALTHLGYKSSEITKLLQGLDPQLDTATLVRTALRQFSSRHASGK